MWNYGHFSAAIMEYSEMRGTFIRRGTEITKQEKKMRKKLDGSLAPPERPQGTRARFSKNKASPAPQNFLVEKALPERIHKEEYK
jgi:hypothetical protein